MTTAPGPYAPSGAPPVDFAKKAANMQLMGILSIVFSLCPCCGGLIALILGIIVLVQAPNVLAMLAQIGSPPDLIGKVNTGKTCAIIGLVLVALGAVGGVVANFAGLLNRG
jgi:hypothetical protein